MHGKQGWKRTALSLLLTATMLLQCAAPIGGMVLAAETEQSQPTVQATQPIEAPKSEPTAAPTAEPTEAPKAEPTAEPTEAPQGDQADEPAATGEPAATDEPTPSDESAAMSDPHPEDTTEVGSGSDQDAPRAPRAVDTLGKVELFDADGGRIAEGDALPKPGDRVKVRLYFDGVKDMAEGDYTVVKLPQALRFAKDDNGKLEGGAGTWALDAGKREVKWTFGDKADGKSSGKIVLEAELAYDGDADVKLAFKVEGVAKPLELTYAPYVDADAAARGTGEAADEEAGETDGEIGTADETGEEAGENDETNEPGEEAGENDETNEPGEEAGENDKTNESGEETGENDEINEPGETGGELGGAMVDGDMSDLMTGLDSSMLGEEPARAPMAISAVTDVTVTITNWQFPEDYDTEAGEPTVVPADVDVTFHWSVDETMQPGDYTRVTIPAELTLESGHGELEGNAGTWALSGQTLTMTFNGGITASGSLTIAGVLADRNIAQLTFDVEGGAALTADVGMMMLFGAVPFGEGTGSSVTPAITIELYQNGDKVPAFTPIALGGGMRIDFAWSFTNEQVAALQPGDYTIIELPDNFEFGPMSGTLAGAGTNFGDWSVYKEGGKWKLKLEFDIPNDMMDVSGKVQLGCAMDEEEIKKDNNSKVEIPFEINGITEKITIWIQPEVTESLTKEGKAEPKINPTKVIWTIDVNKKLENLGNVTVQDTLGQYQQLAGEIKVWELEVKLNGTTSIKGEPATYQNFPIQNLACNNKAYRIEYEATINDPNKVAEELTNTVRVGTTEVTAEVPITRGLDLSKDGSASPAFNPTKIDWEINVNYGLRPLANPVVTDVIPTGLTYDADSLIIVDADGGSVKDNFNVEFSAPTLTISLKNSTDVIDGAYTIKYATTITDKTATSFKNKATLTVGGSSTEKEHTVTIDRGSKIEKAAKGGGVKYNYTDKYIDWRIDINKAEESSDGLITDTIGAGLKYQDGSIKVWELNWTRQPNGTFVWTIGDPVIPTEITYGDYTNENTASTLEINLGNLITKAYRIEYRTDVTDVDATGFTNSATGGGIGTGPVEVPNTIAPEFEKSATTIDYVNQALSWELKIRPLKKAMGSLVITDTFDPADKMTLDPDTVKVVTVSGATRSELTRAGNYTVAAKDGDYAKGFILTFLGEVKDADYIITYKTKLTYAGTVQGEIAGEYSNTAKFTWTDNATGVEKSATHIIDDEHTNNGKKTGELVWSDEGQRRITWKIYVNHLGKTLTDVDVVDTIPEDERSHQKLVPGSIKVYPYTVSAGGSIIPDQTPLSGVTIVPAAYNEATTTFTVKLGNITQPRLIEYQTELTDLRLPKYSNTVDVVGKSYAAEVSYQQNENYLTKSGTHTKYNPWVDWRLWINTAEARITNAKVVDEIKGGHVLDQDSVKVWKYPRMGGVKELQEPGTHYTLSVTAEPSITDPNPSQTMTISFGEYTTIEDRYEITYKTKITTAADGSEVENTASFTGSGQGDSIELEGTPEKVPFFLFAGTGSGTGLYGKLRIEKKRGDYGETDTYIPNIKFDIYRERQGGGRTLIGTGTTDSSGILEIPSIGQGTYFLEEKNVPSGMQQDPRNTMVVEINSGNLVEGVRTYMVLNFPLSQIRIEKVEKGKNDVKLDGVQFNLRKKSTPDIIIETLVTDASGIAESNTSLPFGEYELVEVETPLGYKPQVFPISLTPAKLESSDFDGTYAYFKLENERKLGSVEITKVDSTNTNVKLQGAKFKLVGPDDQPNETSTTRELTTTVAGVAKFENLYPGKYTLTEVSAPAGYHAPEEGREWVFTVREAAPEEDAETIRLDHTVTISNKIIGSVTVTKVDVDNPEIKLEGAVFQLTGSDGAEQTRTTGSNGVAEFTGLKPGDYTLTEVTPPSGYEIDFEPKQITVSKADAEHHQITVTVQNKKTEVTISKVEMVGGEKVELAGAELEIRDKDNKLVKNLKATTDGTEWVITGQLDVNVPYTLVETKAPNGYYIASPITFKMDADGTVKVISGGQMVDGAIEMIDYKIPPYFAPKVKISKVTVTGGPELPGATLKLYDVATGGLIKQWVSGTTPTEFEINGGEGKQYRLVEEISPDGYALAEEIVFTVGEQGSVTPVEMLDKPTHVTISKVGITGGPELPGATLKLFDAEGKLIETWVSGDKPHEIVAKLIAGKTYTLVEESAPDGYTVAESITFTVSRDGRVDKVTMLDRPTDVSISKRRITGSAELRGATLKLVDAEGRLIERWVSGNRPHRIVAKLLAGETYTLIEESAPKGYKIAKPITFTVKMNGEPQRIIMRDALIDPETGDPNEPGTPGYGDPNEPGTPGYGEPGEPGTPGYGVLPETGDNTNAALWLGVLGASLLLLATAVALLRRKRRK